MLRIAAVASLSILLLGLSTGARADSRTFEVPSFNAARFSSALTVNLTVGGTQSIEVEAADPEDLKDVRVKVVNGELRVWADRDFWDFVSFRGGEVTVTVTTPTLDTLKADGATRVNAKGLAGNDVQIDVSAASAITVEDIEAQHVGIRVSAAGSLLVKGTCDVIDAAISSAAIVNARDLVCVTAGIEASSASQAVFHASGNVVAEVSSAANIVLVGDPDHVDDEVSSGGDVDILD